MTLKPADMESCDPKRKCLSGVNAGTAYTPGDECEDGHVFNEANCDCDPLTGTWEFNGIYTDSYGDTGIVSAQFEITTLDQYAFMVGDDHPSWEGGTPTAEWNDVAPWTNEVTLTRTSSFCTGGNTTGIYVRLGDGTTSYGIVNVPGTTLQTLCNRPEGTTVSLSGSYTRIS